MMLPCNLFGSFLLLDLLFGVLCLFWITGIYTMGLYTLSRDDILARQQYTCTLDWRMHDLISELGLRHRGCRGGANYRCRRPAALTSPTSTVQVVNAVEIPVVIGNRRQKRNINICRGERTSVLQSVRRCCTRDNERSNKTTSLLTTQYTPSLYVLNAATLSKSHAVEQLAADLL